jgi:hypothetical protein
MILAHAIRHLFPNADPQRDYELRDDGAGAFIARWNLPNPQPTPAELIAASDAYDLAKAQADADAGALRTQIVGVAQSAAGVLITNLSAVQVRALLAVLLWKAGALDKTGAVKGLSEWA